MTRFLGAEKLFFDLDPNEWSLWLEKLAQGDYLDKLLGSPTFIRQILMLCGIRDGKRNS